MDDSDWALDVDGLGEVELVLGRGLAEVLAHDADAAIPDNEMIIVHFLIYFTRNTSPLRL